MSGKRQTTERFRDKTSYSLYCVNIYGSGLKAIKDEFKRQVGTGLRQTLFVVDLEELHDDLNNQPRNTKMRRELKENFNTYLINSVTQHIQKFRKEYELLTKKINEELKFDLYEYWLQHIEEKTKMSLDKIDKIKEKNSNKEKKTAKLSNASKLDKISCAKELAQEHNRVGQSKLMSQRKYIKDEPTSGKLYIIILGQMSEHFYTDLLRRDQPLEGIINFIPTESNYDIMLGNNKLRNFIAETLEIINSSIYQMRQEVCTKQVGLFNHNLPVISNCLATKHSREIYDQLTWSIYDIDMLKQQYEMYYYRPYQVTDVEIPVSVNLTQLYHVAESLSIQGNFQKCNLPVGGTDLASIAVYLNSLLNTCDLSEELQQSCSDISLCNQNLQNSFSSVTKIPKYERLIVAENNKLLLNMLQYADPNRFQSIYLCCLDYSILRQYPMSSEQQLLPNFIKHDEQNLSNFESLALPKYVKYYANADCSGQRITELLKEYDNYQIQEISPGYKLYAFKRFYNVLNENEGSVIIPTRLCFRDFSLYQMEEFLQNLKTPQLNTDSPSDESIQEQKLKTVEFDENMFIRPHSLKALKFQKDRNSEENRSRKSESRSNRSKNEKKFSLNKSTIKIEESMGLPQDHPLLKGYNLEDTLQVVKYKVSKYYFKLGFVKLYEERWCFQDMNKQLALSINNATIFFHKPRRELKGLGNNIRLVTNNNIGIRILNDPLECLKIVMNYPNGLSVFHHDNYCEQVWNCDQTFRDEQRRIYTTLGAIIVFFKSNDVLMIMRYNGEVYRLYQHELAEEEEEQGFTSDVEDVHEKSSGFKDLKAEGDSQFIIDKTKYHEYKKHKSKTTADQQEIQRKSDLHTLNSKKSRKSQKLLSEESIKISSKSNSVTNNLRSSVLNELNFINLLCSTYELKYLHLIITTSQGRRINLTHQGEIFEGPQCSIQEWHDYFANEAYCERSDGVKMIWSQDCFKCFHKDGSVFKTTIEEDIFREEVDEFESQITQSSSHNLIKAEMEEDGANQELEGNFTQTVKTLGKLNSCVKPSTYTITEAAEEYLTLDVPFVSYSCNSWFMQHQNYAEVYVLTPKLPKFSPNMEIFGIDNIRIYTHTETFFKTDDSNVCDYDSLQSEGEEYTTDKLNIKVAVNVKIGDQLHVTADKDGCEVYAVLGQSKVEKERKSDSLTLSFKYTDCINYAFKYLVNEIASFDTNNRHKKEELYYIEQMNKDSVKRGFEFFSKLPQLSLYNYHVSNNITQLKAVNTINELMANNCDGYKKDLNKFPRFKQPEKQDIDAIVDVPQLLSANLFTEIPRQLRNMANITKFLEPFECINFKKLRGKFKNILNFYLKPQNDLKAFSSTKNWKRRHWEHERRLFTEQQRLGLYQAMSKHKFYPNYWKFTNVYKGEVRRIEFFEFMQNTWDNKEEKTSN